MKLQHVHVLAIILAAIGLSVFAYKWLVTGLPLTSGELAPAWEVETRIAFDANGGPVKVKSFMPENSRAFAILDKRYIAKGYGLSARTEADNRKITLATRSASGAQVVHMRFTVHRFSRHGVDRPGANGGKVSRKVLSDAKLTAAHDILGAAKQRSADTAGLVSAVLNLLRSTPPSDAVRELLGKKDDPASRADAAVAILALDRISARRVNGIHLGAATKKANIMRWLEVHIGDKWVDFSVQTGNPEIPDNAMPWWRGSEPLVEISGGRNAQRLISYVQLEERVLDRVLVSGKNRQDEFVTFSLFGLPLATQEVYRIILMVPIGIFLLLILRNVVGLRSLGTFMPVLIALAFRETNLAWGLILFVGIVGSGLLFRLYLEYLKLLLVPRLAAVLIFVVLFMALISVVTAKLGFERGISIALFPMVIMTMTIERISILWDERGPADAIRQAVGSLAIAAVCYVIMTQDLLVHLFFTFPELLLVLLAATLVLGRYTGYRLLELKRFRVLAGDG